MKKTLSVAVTCFFVWQMRDFQKYCWWALNIYLFLTWKRLLMPLMILFLYKCIKHCCYEYSEIMCVYKLFDVIKHFASIYYEYLLLYRHVFISFTLFFCFAVFVSIYLNKKYSPDAGLLFVNSELQWGVFHEKMATRNKCTFLKG